MRALLLSTAVLTIGFFACRSLPGRWEAYEGCTADQCQAWYEECEAECLHKKRGSVSTCQSVCGGKIESCRLACGG
ncbi:MAG: hypothetical protein AAGD10_20630 [Myxococcota bacterium]